MSPLSPASPQRFVIKWKGFSHLHNTEETYEYLRASKYKGFKRVDNYIKSVWTIQNRILTSPSTTREDLEAFNIEKERINEVRPADASGCRSLRGLFCLAKLTPGPHAAPPDRSSSRTRSSSACSASATPPRTTRTRFTGSSTFASGPVRYSHPLALLHLGRR